MQEIFNFLIEVGKLKRMPRRGWVINQIKKPESIAEHIFRAAIMGWILGKEKTGLNVERLLKMALIHDLCEIYAGDETPYDSILPKNKKKLRELMKTWPRFPSSERERKIYSKHQREKKSLKKLVTGLPKNFKNEILNLWLDYESCLTPEGRFLHQADRMENFLQAYEYWKKYKNPPLGPWWLWAREFFDDPLLLKFMEVLEKKFHQQKIPERLKSSIALLNFFSEVGKLKRKPRRGWIIHQIKNPETTAEHIFRMAIIAWALGKKKRLNIERVIKMALIHDLCEVCAPDLTPYDPLLPKDQKKIMETLKHWPKFTPSLKVKTYKKKYKLETRALNKLISKLSSNLKSEIKNLWLDYEKGLTKEGRFVKQVDKVENFLQGMEYWKKHGKIQHRLWIRWIKEIIDDPILLEFIKTLEKKFHRR
ncbi:MAG: hypothetical protein COU43_00795 [Candidatus Nealsonbacteria bacterium CG10_big_fil_rev_8_21_14_0_10_37_25]|uniref:5'-deoxynucleotidase n=1 Tax=Candidatus Nealsonbacteria bacterium CG10_big_fil_rev_8_21_14_0_10_37_25 TaxID=1974711 RepID=A0A2H0TJN8_9BACT|nr:MAG: hypothetical protein COU43_00795 [Candidatus Nealsonbacteria bacterium CG10_big_fil_rev_8_21_14_0_10_37_25]